jgi:hypothetical protein
MKESTCGQTMLWYNRGMRRTYRTIEKDTDSDNCFIGSDNNCRAFEKKWTELGYTFSVVEETAEKRVYELNIP